jgi:hypothetical protein
MIVALIGVASVLPALAGPDWQIIEHGRKVKAERMRAEQAKQQQTPRQTDQHSQMMKDCMEMMKKS